MLSFCRNKAKGGLTDKGILLILESPKNVRGVAIAFSQSPTVKKVLPAISAIFRAPAGIVSCGWRVSIGRPATSRTREGWRSRTDRGALYGLPLFLIPKIVRGCYVPELY